MFENGQKQAGHIGSQFLWMPLLEDFELSRTDDGTEVRFPRDRWAAWVGREVNIT